MGTTYIGFLTSPAALIFMPVAAIVISLAGPDDVGEERVAGTHASPDGVHLVGAKRDGLVHAGEVEV